MCDEYQALRCAHCGLTNHYPVKSANLVEEPSWHCSLCGRKQPKQKRQKLRREEPANERAGGQL